MSTLRATTSTGSHHSRGASRSSSRLLSATQRLAAAAAILLLLIGPPALLAVLVGNPLDVPAGLRTSDALTRPTNDTALLWILSIVGWLTWLRLLACLILETFEQVRGASPRMPRMPLPGLLFGADRRLATHLIAVLLMTAHPSDNVPLTPATAPVTAAVTTVSANDLHSPVRSSLIVGTADSGTTTPNQMPPTVGAAERSRTSATINGITAARAPIECRVLPPAGRHHDTLWDIAERHLGDGLRWREIFTLNDGRVMPDGQQLTQASLIRPGWILRLPADATILTLDHVPPSTPPAAPTPRDAAGPAGHPRPRAADTPASDLPPKPVPAPAIPSSAQTAAPDPGLAAPAAPATPVGPAPSLPSAVSTAPADRTDRSTPAASPTDEPSTPSAIVAELGSLLLAAAALLASLSRRRKIAARRRPLGVRPTRPTPELLEAERQLRRQARSAEDIGATLRLALLVAAKATPTIRVKAVWEHPDGTIELVLLDHDPDRPAPAPFENAARGWQLTPEGQRYLFAVRSSSGSRRQDRTARLEEHLQAAPDPFPVLLPVGAQDGSACLVNLELLGLISVISPDRINGTPKETSACDAPTGDVSEVTGVTSDRDEVKTILAAWAQGLAGAPWAELTQIYVPGAWGELATGLATVHSLDLLTPEGTSTVGIGPRPVPAGTRHDYAHTQHLEAARRAAIGGADTVTVNVSIGYTTQEIPTWLAAAATDPLDPNVLLLAAPHPEAHRWLLAADGTLRIPGIADHLTPLRLDSGEHALLLRLLEHAEDPPHAAPDDPARAELLAQCPPLHDAPEGAEPTPTPAPPAAGAAHDHHQNNDNDTENEALSPATQDIEPATIIDLTIPATAPPATEERKAFDEDAFADQSLERAGSENDSLPADNAKDVGLSETAGNEATDAVREPEGLGPEQWLKESLPPGPVEVCVLGPLEVHGTVGELPRRQALDVLVHLAMHRRPVPADVLFEAVWPSSGYNSRTLRNRISEVRGYIAPGVDHTRGGYQLPDLVQTDWQRFQTLARGDAEAQLAALQLVRGRPFEGSTLDWMHLEGQFAEMEAAIVDLALHVGTEALRHEQYDVARDACYAGLRGCPYDERLYRIGMESAAARGATSEVRELRRRLELILEGEVDDDIQPATRELYQRLNDEDELRTRRHQRHS